jgi:hypothetical protein
MLLHPACRCPVSLSHTTHLPNPNQPSYDDRDWASIARDYAARALTVEQIAALYDVSLRAIYHRARRDGWPRRIAKPGNATRHRVPRADFGQRLINALDRRIADLETRRDAPAGSVADAEREARTLNTLVRLYEKLRAAGYILGPAARKSAHMAASSSAAPAAKDTDDPDGLRRELARRLETLRLGQGG